MASLVNTTNIEGRKKIPILHKSAPENKEENTSQNISRGFHCRITKTDKDMAKKKTIS